MMGSATDMPPKALPLIISDLRPTEAWAKLLQAPVPCIQSSCEVGSFQAKKMPPIDSRGVIRLKGPGRLIESDTKASAES